MKTVYIQKSLEEILNFYSRGFKPPEGEHIVKTETVVDPPQNKVIFILTLASNPTDDDKKILIDPPDFLSNSPNIVKGN